MSKRTYALIAATAVALMASALTATPATAAGVPASKATVSAVNIGPNSYPTLLFNGMINPILPYGIKGAIWYQGESNHGEGILYLEKKRKEEKMF